MKILLYFFSSIFHHIFFRLISIFFLIIPFGLHSLFLTIRLLWPSLLRYMGQLLILELFQNFLFIFISHHDSSAVLSQFKQSFALYSQLCLQCQTPKLFLKSAVFYQYPHKHSYFEWKIFLNYPLLSLLLLLLINYSGFQHIILLLYNKGLLYYYIFIAHLYFASCKSPVIFISDLLQNWPWIGNFLFLFGYNSYPLSSFLRLFEFRICLNLSPLGFNYVTDF